MHHYILVGKPPGDIVLLGQPGKLHIAFDLIVFLRRYSKRYCFVPPAVVSIAVFQ